MGQNQGLWPAAVGLVSAAPDSPHLANGPRLWKLSRHEMGDGGSLSIVTDLWFAALAFFAMRSYHRAQQELSKANRRLLE